MTTRRLILASSSIYRQELLTRLQIPFESISPEVDETPYFHESPHETSVRLAQLKARKVGDAHKDALVIGCDQVATLDGEQLGKPMTHDNAVLQLEKMQGREVAFHSALCLYNPQSGMMQSDDIITIVRFRHLNADQIESYLRKEQPYHCAGSAKSEGLGIALLAEVRSSDPNALVGLPLIRLITMLQHEGVNVI